MVSPAVNLSNVGQAIQLAITPVFLLTGIAGMLNVMTARLARIVDRRRHLIESPALQTPELAEPRRLELASLEHRRYFAGVAIAACTFSALLVCTVIAALFLGVLLNLEFNWLLGLLFTFSTFALVVGLAYFLREVHLATRTKRI